MKERKKENKEEKEEEEKQNKTKTRNQATLLRVFRPNLGLDLKAKISDRQMLTCVCVTCLIPVCLFVCECLDSSS